MESSSAAVTAKPKAKLKGNKKEDKEKNPKGKVTKGKGKEVVLNSAKFEGQGLSYKAKLFGFVEVAGPRGDQSSVQAIQKLKQQAKQLKKGANEHKLKITFNITLQGVRLYNEKTQTIEHEHPIHKISFISHDPEDRHVFGYIYSPPRSAANETRKYYLFAIKSDKSADVITVQLYELFQVVYKMQENKKVQSKDNTTVKQRKPEKSAQPLEPLQNKMLLEMSNKIGGDQQQYPTEEHLYAEPAFVKRTPSEPPPEYAVPRQQNESNVVESENMAAGFALSLRMNDSYTNMQEISQPKSENVSTPITDDDSGFETVFDKTPSFSTEEFSNENAFHVEFPPFENGFTSSENVRSPLGLSESSYDSEKFNIPSSSEMQVSPSNQISLNVFGNSSNPDVKTDFETSKTDTVSINSQVFVSSESTEGATFNSTETKDDDFISTQVESKPTAVEEVAISNSTVDEFSSFESEKQKDSEVKIVQTENPTTSKTNNFVTQSSFEVTFETENVDIKTSKRSEPDAFSFHSNSDAFSNTDPFASTSPTNFDQSAFSAFADDDPFSPKGGSNKNTKSDPFAENDDFFTADFSDVNTKDINEQKKDIFDETNSENDQSFESSSKEEDIFEAMFEAKMEEQIEDETLNNDENKMKPLNNTQENQNEGNLENSSAEGDPERDTQEEEFIQTPEENQDEMALPDKDTNEPVHIPVLNNLVNNEVSQEQQENQETISNEEDNVEELNAFDFSSNDVYVTLKTAVQPSNRPLSPTEFSPPPLPPRPVPSIPTEHFDTITSPRIPPALPPRPSNLPQAETTIRKPPELPPRLDLEENGVIENELADNVLENQSSTNNIHSPMFQADFDTFDFDNVENSADNNSGTPARDLGSPVPGFGSIDPFKDPFAGSDPFQTPVPGSDPFQTPGKQDNEDFDPFSGNDPFAMTPAFDIQASFSSPSNRNLSSVDEPSNDDDKDKFADFSAAFA